jgi:predicted RNA-binding protein with PUA-like domain
MKKGEQAFFYHTGKERAIVGIVRVIAEAHPDSTGPVWSAVEVAAVRPLPTPVGLEQIKANKRLAAMVLVRQARLSVQPADAEWRLVCKMGGPNRAPEVAERSGARAVGQMDVVGLMWDRYVWPLTTGGAAR